MPYKAEQDKENTENWNVVNTATNEVKATHTPPDAKEKAEHQVKLLHEVENDPEWGDNE